MNEEVLNSWKEIAAYLGRGVRTVQRWEQDLALPVRRPRGKERSAVIALKSDLNRWLERVPPGNGSGAVSSNGSNEPHDLVRQHTQLLKQRTAQLVQQSHRLHSKITQSVALAAALQAKRVVLIKKEISSGSGGAIPK